jgi:uncharacterized RDD family membrane protein YckC
MNALAQKTTLSGSRLDNRRMLAALIDLALVGAGGAAIVVAAGSLGAPLAAVLVGWALYYYFACESGGGQTLGKKLTKVRVVREDGTPAGTREIAVRTVLRVVDTAVVGLIAMLATGERRARLGDLAAGTMVVSTEPARAGSPSAPPAATADDEPAAWDEESVEAEPALPYQPITRFDPIEDELDITSPSLKELAGDVAAAAGSAPDEEEREPVVEAEPVVEVTPAPEPLVGVDVGGPEIDVDSSDLTVRSVETVSAIDLVMGADEPSEDRPAADEPPAGA